MIIDVPEPVANLLPSDPDQRVRAVLEGVVIGAYTRGMISRGRAGELLGMSYWEADKFFAEHGIFMNYDLGDFQKDLQT